MKRLLGWPFVFLLLVTTSAQTPTSDCGDQNGVCTVAISDDGGGGFGYQPKDLEWTSQGTLHWFVISNSQTDIRVRFDNFRYYNTTTAACPGTLKHRGDDTSTCVVTSNSLKASGSTGQRTDHIDLVHANKNQKYSFDVEVSKDGGATFQKLSDPDLQIDNYGSQQPPFWLLAVLGLLAVVGAFTVVKFAMNAFRP